MKRVGQHRILVLLAGVYETDPRVQRTVRCLVGDGFEVEVLAVSRSGESAGATGRWKGDFGEEVRQLGVKPLYPGGRRQDMARNLFLRYGPVYARMFVGGLMKGGDAVHANDVQTLPLAVAMKQTGRARVVIFDAHEFSPRLSSPGSLMAALSPVWRGMVRGLRGWIDASVMVGPTLARRYEELGVRNMHIIRNVPEIRRGDGSERLPEEFSTRRPLRVLYLGTMFPGRGIETGLHAARELVDEGLPVRFRFVGRPRPPEYAELVEGLVESRGGAMSLEPPVPYESLGALYSENDVGLILLERNEANEVYLPNKLFEMMMGGLAVVATDLPDIASVLRCTGSGVCFDGSVASLADALRGLIVNPRRIEDMQKRAWSAAHERYNWEAESERLVSLYRGMLARGLQ